MFGMVLAIGIIVDDAIVVVENVERLMAQEGLSPREATLKAMKEITGAVVGITLVLIAVFIPMAFASGSVGSSTASSRCPWRSPSCSRPSWPSA
jgi:multidrug efflux pump